MKIVVEYVFLENFVINSIVLRTTALLTKEKGKLFLLSAFLSTCFTVIMPMLRLNVYGSFLIKIGIAILNICLSFRFKTAKKFLQLFLCYFVTLFIYGGACYFFENLFGIESILVILAIVVVVYLVVKFLAKKCKRKSLIENFCCDIEIVSFGQKTKCKAFLDSGNFLYDPLTDSPVSIINFKVFSMLYKEIELSDVIMQTSKIKKLKFAHFVKFTTLNKDDKILVFQVEKMYVSGKLYKQVTLGLSLKNFDQAFDSDVILNSNFALCNLEV